jgi:hypothetical protein
MVQSLLKNTVPRPHIARSHAYLLRAMLVAGLSDWYNFGD